MCRFFFGFIEMPSRSSNFRGKLNAFLLLARIYFSPVTVQTWHSLLAVIRKRFPSVRHISADDLASWLADPNRPAPLLIDARAENEFAISHLQNAIHSHSAKSVHAIAKSTSQPIVVYCS